MSGQINLNTVQLGTSSTATQNFVITVPSVQDGTMNISRGNYGATSQTILGVDASGNLTTAANVTVPGNLTVSGAISGSSFTGIIQPVTASVAANALTVGLNATGLAFRNTTVGGLPVLVNSASPLTLTVPTTATLGTTNGAAARLVLLALNNAGVMALGIINIAGGTTLDETQLVNTTAISTSATSNNVIYSASALTGVAYRVVGFVDITEATAGAWATGPTNAEGTTYFAPFASPTLYGVPTSPTPAQFNNSTDIATTAFVQTASGNYQNVVSVSGTTTLTASQLGSAVELSGSTTYTVTLPTPVGYTGKTFSVWSTASVAITFSTPAGTIIPPAGSGASTYILPAYSTAEFIADNSNWVVAFGSVNQPTILPITTSVATNALTVGLNSTQLSFRNTTVGGAPVTITNVSALSLTVPSTATLGTTSGVSARLVVLALNNAGTMALGIVNQAGGLILDGTGLVSTTAISTAATANNVIYSAATLSNVAYRVIGYIDITEATAGTWATAASNVVGAGTATPELSNLAVVTARGASTGSVVSLTNSTASSSSSTGALIITGGLYAGANSYFNGSVGIGAAAQTSATLYVSRNDADTTAASMIANYAIVSASNASGVGSKIGLYGVAQAVTGYAGTGTLYGVYGNAQQTNAVGVSGLIGVEGVVNTLAAGTIATAIGIQAAAALNASSTVTNLYGISVNSLTGSNTTYIYGINIGDSTTATNIYGLYIGTSNGSNKYAVYAAGTAPSLFNGSITLNGGLTETGSHVINQLGTPTAPTGVGSTTGGTVAAATYYAKLVAVDAVGTVTSAESLGVTTTGATSSITWSWAAVSGATSYQLWVGTSVGNETSYFTSVTTSVVQTTSAGTVATIPTGNSTGNLKIANQLGVGTAPLALTQLYSVRTDTDTSSSNSIGVLGITNSTNASGSGNKIGLGGTANANASFAGTGSLYGVNGGAIQNAAVSISAGLYGVNGSATTTAAGTIAAMYGVTGVISINAATTVTNAFGLYSGTITTGTNTTNAYGLYLNAVTGATNNYALYSAGTAASYFGGVVTGVTAANTDNSTKFATTAYVQSVADQIQPVTATVASNALTVGLNATNLTFRNTTVGSAPVRISNASALSLVVPTSATLGTTNGVAARLVLLALNAAGTMVLGIINIAGGTTLDETGLVSTTAISAAATSNNVIYTTAAQTSVAYRVIGFVDITEATAGTWATAPTNVQGSTLIAPFASPAFYGIPTAPTPVNTTNSTQVATTAYVQSVANQIQPITSSVASNALTVGLNPTNLSFRNVTVGSAPVVISNASALSLTVPSTATLGTVSTIAARLVILALNNAGTMALGIVNIAGGTVLDESGLVSTTAISAAATANNVIYSTAALTNVAYRVVGYVDITEATAGTWATAATNIQGGGQQVISAMGSIGYGQTWQNVTGSRAVSTTYYNTTGKPIYINVSGTIAGGSYPVITAIINGITISGTAVPATTTGGSISGIVPAGASYSVTPSAGTLTLVNWSELR